MFATSKKETFIKIKSATLISIAHYIFIEGKPTDPYNLQDFFYFITGSKIPVIKDENKSHNLNFPT